jgi:hypothetical protein
MPEADVPGLAPDRLVQALPVAGCLPLAPAVLAAVAVVDLPFEALLGMRVFSRGWSLRNPSSAPPHEVQDQDHQEDD